MTQQLEVGGSSVWVAPVSHTSSRFTAMQLDVCTHGAEQVMDVHLLTVAGPVQSGTARGPCSERSLGPPEE